MKKEKQIERRREYVKQRIESARNRGTEVKRLADELFLNQRTIYRDLEKH